MISLVQSAAFFMFIFASAASSPVRAADFEHYTTVLTGGSAPSVETIYRSLRDNFRRSYRALPFPSDTTGIVESYATSPRSVYARLEAASLLELLHARSGGEFFDDAGNHAERRRRLANLAGWALWLLSTEAASRDLNLPDKHRTAGRASLRGWGLLDANTGSTYFEGWDTFAEQTSVPIIALLQTAKAIEAYLRAYPAAKTERLFSVTRMAAIKRSGRLRILTGEGDKTVDLNGLFLGDIPHLLVRHSQTIMDWWIANATSQIADYRYFWYSAVGKADLSGSGLPIREWFVVHANMLMGRALVQLGDRTNREDYRQFARGLFALFKRTHYQCTSKDGSALCYHYGVLAKDLAGSLQTITTTNPVRARMIPEWRLEEPFHMNASHALVATFATPAFSERKSRSLRSIYTGEVDPARCPHALGQINGTTGGGRIGFTHEQCTRAPIQGPPLVSRNDNGDFIVDASKYVLTETVALAGKPVHMPDYHLRGQPIAGYYLSEFSNDALFRTLHQWWDAYARRVSIGAEGDCFRSGCPNPFSGLNFMKMGAFLSMSAFERVQKNGTRQPQPPHPGPQKP